MIRVSRNFSILGVMVVMTVTVMLTATVAFAIPNEGGNGQAKVTLCHKDMNTITVGEPAVAAHERHGDTLGACAEVPPEGTTPELTTMATATATLGDPISDTATLSGATDDATGTITFNVYGPDDEDCSGEPAFTSVVDVNGNGVYSSDLIPNDPSDDFVPGAVGTYRWTADYSGDDNNGAVASECNAPDEASVVTEASLTTPELTTMATATATLGDPISDTATLSGATSDATGKVTFKLYGPFTDTDASTDTCVDPDPANNVAGNLVTTIDVDLLGSPDASGNYLVSSGDYAPTAAGRYQWVVFYGGDANNGEASSECKAANEASVVTEPTTTSATEQNSTVTGFNGRAAKHAKATKLTALTWASS
jgi:hypothetical protein